jgi:hypothetical protein
VPFQKTQVNLAEKERKIRCVALEEHQSAKNIPQICWTNLKNIKKEGAGG